MLLYFSTFEQKVVPFQYSFSFGSGAGKASTLCPPPAFMSFDCHSFVRGGD